MATATKKLRVRWGLLSPFYGEFSLKVEIIEVVLLRDGGAFGYQAETVEVSKAMGELSLLPAVRAPTRTRESSLTEPVVDIRSPMVQLARLSTSR